jgi:hypothetical protein
MRGPLGQVDGDEFQVRAEDVRRIGAVQVVERVDIGHWFTNEIDVAGFLGDFLMSPEALSMRFQDTIAADLVIVYKFIK